MKNQNASFASRKQKIVSCPFCWTDQRSSRNFCYACGATFSFLDEAASPPGSGAAIAGIPAGFVDTAGGSDSAAGCVDAAGEYSAGVKRAPENSAVCAGDVSEPENPADCTDAEKACSQ